MPNIQKTKSKKAAPSSSYKKLDDANIFHLFKYLLRDIKFHANGVINKKVNR